jgi:hypothetical protein
MRVLFALLVAAAIGVGPACTHQPEVIEPAGPPPLPPSTGTAIGYLIDAKLDLALRDDQMTKLKELDDGLAGENGDIDAQLRQIEKPVEPEQLTPQQMKAGEKPQRYNNAPGASTTTTDNSQKLRKMHDENEQHALEKAFAVLDEDQRPKAARILQDRGIRVPASALPATK